MRLEEIHVGRRYEICVHARLIVVRVLGIRHRPTPPWSNKPEATIHAIDETTAQHVTIPSLSSFLRPVND